MIRPRFWALVGMIAAAAVARVLPHPWNVTPVAAMALFGGVHFRDKSMAFGVPLLAMLLSDAAIGFHSLVLVVYACFALTVCIGFWIKQEFSVERIVLGSVAASLSFFMITNFAMWLMGTMYPKTASGLALCYAAGLPYLRNTLIGDLAYTALFFGTFYLAEKALPALQDASPA